MRGRLNLATRPFRNEALPNLLFVLGVALTAALSAAHALHLRGLLGDTSSALRRQVRSQEAELQSLRGEERVLRAPQPEAAKLAEWRAVKDLVDRRTFSWTLLLSRLEGVLPRGIRLISISPRVRSEEMYLDLVVVAKSREEGFDFVHTLQDSGSFKNVYPTTVDTTPRGEQFQLSMRYSPPEARP